MHTPDAWAHTIDHTCMRQLPWLLSAIPLGACVSSNGAFFEWLLDAPVKKGGYFGNYFEILVILVFKLKKMAI